MIVAPAKRSFTALRRRSFKAAIDNFRPSLLSINNETNHTGK
jgi:hypothetical protein